MVADSEYWRLSTRKYRSTVVLYFWLSFVGLFLAGSAVYLLFIEPARIILIETSLPSPAAFTVRRGEAFSYRRSVSQYRDCLAKIRRVLSCKDGYRHLYRPATGGLPIGPSQPRYVVQVPDEAPLGQCQYDVTLGYECVWLESHVHLHPIKLNVVE